MLLLLIFKVAVRVVADFTEYPYNYLPQTIQRATEIIGLAGDGRREDNRWEHLVSYKAYIFVKSSGCQ